MDSLKVSTVDDDEDEDGLDPRIQIELEKLNSATDVINKLEMQLDEANTTFRMLMTDSTRRLKASSSRLGASIVRARPYYEAVELSKRAQQECQRAAVKFQRANEIHQAAKETVALAEARFLSKQHEWQFDNAWQEMLNHATIKVTEAENQKSESGREHQKRALLFNAAEQKVQLLEQRLKRSISKSRPYFEEKAQLQARLDNQKSCISQLEAAVQRAKAEYAASLQRLEQISEEIHRRRNDKSGTATPRGPREPGVGAELEPVNLEMPRALPVMDSYKYESRQPACVKDNLSLEFDLDSCDVRSVDSVSRATSSAVSEADDLETDPLEEDLEELKQRVRELAVRDNVSRSSESWENELTATIDKLDNALLMRECEMELRESCGVGSVGAASSDTGFFSVESSGVNSLGVGGPSDVADGGRDVVKNSHDGVGNSSGVVMDVVKNSDVVDKNSRVLVNQGSDVVNKTSNVVKNSSDFVNQGSDFVNKTSNVVKDSSDFVNQGSDFVNKASNVVKDSSDFVNQGSDFVNKTSNVVKNSSDFVNQGSNVVVKNSGDVVIQRSDVVIQRSDVVIQRSDVVKNSHDVKKSGNVMNQASDVVKDSNDVVNQGSDVVVKNSGDVVIQGSNVVKNSDDVVKNSEDIVNQERDVVKDGSDAVENSNDVVKNNNDDVKNQGIDVVEDSTDIVKNINDVVENSSNVINQGSNVVKNSDNVVKNRDDIVKDSIDFVNQTSNVVEDSSDLVDSGKDVVKNSSDIASNSSDVVKQKTDVSQSIQE